ncbi:MAG: hypothetical protein KJ749_05395 [Planctomycetes bacterium]|nr:hypothetical protein [Planctomycetota bacterium]
MRALVVAGATLAILLVCFSIYQYSQLDPEATGTGRPRLPDAPVHSPDSDLASVEESSGGVTIGPAVIKGGSRPVLSIFPRTGTRAWGEISMDRYMPVAGTGNEFRLTAPELRLRMNDGRAVRATAEDGILEMKREGTAVDPVRGRLSGNVVIEIDRLTEEERAARPEEEGGQSGPDPAQFIRIELDEIEFDGEYSKVVVPGGRFHLYGSDVDFRASGMEIRFNESEGRIEYLRVNDGGVLVLGAPADQLGLSIPRSSAGPARQASLMGWIRTTLAMALQAQASAEVVADRPTEEPNDRGVDDDVPVFGRDKGETSKRPEPPVKYYARFEDTVDARQVVGLEVESRLQADVLEMLREFNIKGAQPLRAESSVGPPLESAGLAEASPVEQTVVKWNGRLLIEVVLDGDSRWADQGDSRVWATGSPVRTSSAQGESACAKLTFDFEEAKVRLEGTDLHPAEIRMAEQGLMTGRSVYSERTDDDFVVRVDGPGSFTRAPDADLDAGGVETDRQETIPTVEFSQQMELHGRFVARTKFSLTWGIASREQRVYERAILRGEVVMRGDDASLASDSVVILFGNEPDRRRGRQDIARVEGRGQVTMSQGQDRIVCRDIDITLATDQAGKSIPVTAMALGDVQATQGDRKIAARDRLEVIFESITRPAAPFDPFAARAAALAAGRDPAGIDWETKRREHEAIPRGEVGVKRLKAFGAVSILDPSQNLEVTADQLDCSIDNGRDIERAHLVGTEESPAFVRLRDFDIAGREIELDVAGESARVPGAGRMSFRSAKDLDGRPVKDPIPISIAWAERMTYEGRENRAVFVGEVHAASSGSTTFDADHLAVDFDDVTEPVLEQPPSQDWWILHDLAGQLSRGDGRDSSVGIDKGRFRKQPAYILATGRARLETAEFDEDAGELKTRAHLSGPRLSVNLRAGISKMLIEGAGVLLLEDFRPSAELQPTARPRKPAGLLSLGRDGGASKTFIQWQDSMSYDFAAYQTRFEGDVVLRHYSGRALDDFLGQSRPSQDLSAGRSTQMTCDLLSVDFRERDHGSRPSGDRRMGGLSADRLRQFQASGSVRLHDETEKLSLAADRVVYERGRQLLSIHGLPQQPFRFTQQKPGKLPINVNGERAFYDLATGELEQVSKLTVTR